MSLIRCDKCDDVFDSDADPDCFIETAEETVVICVNCRDELEIELC